MDISYLLFIQKARLACGSIFDQLFLFISELATPLTTFLLMAFTYWCIDKKAGALMEWNVGVGCTYNTTLKRFFNVERPWVKDARITPVEAALSGAGDASFPSGHTSRATAVWGALGTVFLKKKKETRIIGIASWLVVLAVMFSRNYQGVHTPQDVVGALLLGIVVMYATAKVIVWADTNDGRYDLAITLVGMIICFTPMLRYGCFANSGAGMGLLAGWYAERKWVKFSTEGNNSRKTIRFVFGAVPLLLIIKVLPSLLTLFMESKYAGYFTYGIIGFYIMAVYPLLFTIAEKNFDKNIKRATAGIIVFALMLTIVGYGRNHALRVAAIKEQAQGTTENTIVNPSGTIGYMQYSIAEDGTIVTEDNMGYQIVDQGDSWYYSDGLVNTVDDSRKKMDVIGHRGYPAVAPENTLPSFKAAMDLGVDWIETDVQETKDGVLVLFHDDDLARITGVSGKIADYTYDELLQMDFGAWFSDGYAGTKIPTLQEFMDLVKDDDVRIYLELKDIGEVDGFVEAIYNVIEQNGMHDRVVYASFNYGYLQQFKAIDSSTQILCNTMLANESILLDTPAEYYGINSENASTSLINAIHNAGSKVFVWTPDSPQQMQNLYRMGVDGVCTNQSGVAMAASHPEYEYLADNAIWSHALPGLYDNPALPDYCADMVFQGFTKTSGNLISAAYSKSGEYNSVLYIMDLNGNLLNIVDTGFKAHMGGIAYDANHDILWTTGMDGMVYAISMTAVLDGSYNGEILAQFDANLYNAAGGHVASFLTVDDGYLYVGSYSNGANGALNKYDISDYINPTLISTVTIPERIQGVTFRELSDRSKTILMTQGYEMYEGFLLEFIYSDDNTEYINADRTLHLPEGPEQILWTSKGLYLQLESASTPYLPTARNACDQLWLLQLEE